MQAIQGTPQSDPLAQLKDIHVPSTVNTWPLDWGWWCLGAMCLLLVIAVIVIAVRKYKYNQPRREAKALLKALSPSLPNWPMEINIVLKRTALSYYSSQDVASLYGNNWVSFLLDSVPKKHRTRLEKGLLQLNELHYSPSPDEAYFDECIKAATSWLNYVKPTPAALGAKKASTHSNEIKQEASHA